MKGPGIAIYKKELARIKQSAFLSGKEYIDVNSKELHTKISPKHATTPTCCQAMYKCMLEEDALLQVPKGSTGLGSRLTIRYYLHNLEERPPFSTVKKRGRPCRREDQPSKHKVIHKPLNDMGLSYYVQKWLEQQACTYHMSEDGLLHVDTSEGDWILHLRGIKRGRKKTLSAHIVDTLHEVSDENSKHSIVFNDNYSYRSTWDAIPQEARDRIQMSLLLVDKKGHVHEV